MSGNEVAVPLSNSQAQPAPSNSTINAIASEDAGFDINEQLSKQIPHHPERFLTPPVIPGIPPIPIVPDWREASNNNLYVKNIADGVSEEQLRGIFSPHGELISVKIMTNEKGESKGFGFVCFIKTADAFKAKHAMHGYMLDKKPLYVSFAQKKEDRQKHLQQIHSTGYPMHPAYPPTPYSPVFNYPPPEFFPRNSPISPYPPQPQPPITYLGEIPPQYTQPKNNRGQGPKRGQYPPGGPGIRGNGNGQYKNNRNYQKPNNNRRDYPPHEHYPPPISIPGPFPPESANPSDSQVRFLSHYFLVSL